MARIEHTAIFASDLERLRGFYVETMGLRVIVDNSKAPTRGYFLADDHGAALEIIERPADVPKVSTRYVCHTAFSVDDYDAAYRSLASNGIVFESGTAVETPEFRTAFFNDPQGNRCQIVWRAKPLGS